MTGMDVVIVMVTVSVTMTIHMSIFAIIATTFGWWLGILSIGKRRNYN
jgi:hypothetical protein